MGGVEAGFDLLETLFENGSSQNGGCGCSITCLVVSLAGDALHQTGSNVNALVRELDGFGNCNTVLGDLGAAVGLVDQNISSTWTQSH